MDLIKQWLGYATVKMSGKTFYGIDLFSGLMKLINNIGKKTAS